MPTTGIYFPNEFSKDDLAAIRAKLGEIAAGLGYSQSPGELLAAIALGELEVIPHALAGGPRPAFAQALAGQIAAATGHPISPETISIMLAGAAADAVGEIAPVRVRREISPVSSEPNLIIIESDEDRLVLFPDDIPTLRALLCALDESAPPQPGEALTVPVRTEDGRVVSRWEEEPIE